MPHVQGEIKKENKDGHLRDFFFLWEYGTYYIGFQQKENQITKLGVVNYIRWPFHGIYADHIT